MLEPGKAETVPNTEALEGAAARYGEGKIVIDKLTPEEIDYWWPIYDEPFRELNRENPCRQSFNREEFEEAMTSPTMAKLAYVKDGEVISMSLLSNDFGHFPWMSQEFYKNKYPELYENKQVYYFVSLLTRPEYQNSMYGVRVVKFITELFALDDNEALVTFDCCPANAEMLPSMINWAVDRTGLGQIEFDEVGTQHYFAGQLILKKEAEVDNLA